MKGSHVVLIALVSATLGAAPAVYAAPVTVPVSIHGMFSKQPKAVSVSLRNDSNVPLELKIADKVMTLDAGKTVSLKLPVGTRILANDTTPSHAAGTLIEEVTKSHDGAMIRIR